MGGGYHHLAKMFIFVDIFMLILGFIFKKEIKMKSENDLKMSEKCLLSTTLLNVELKTLVFEIARILPVYLKNEDFLWSDYHLQKLG